MISQKVLSSSAFCRLFPDFADYEEVQGGCHTPPPTPPRSAGPVQNKRINGLRNLKGHQSDSGNGKYYEKRGQFYCQLMILSGGLCLVLCDFVSECRHVILRV